MAEVHRRRRRVRSDSDAPTPADLAALTSPVHDPEAEPAVEDKAIPSRDLPVFCRRSDLRNICCRGGRFAR